jgi:hypothetical protein
LNIHFNHLNHFIIFYTGFGQFGVGGEMGAGMAGLGEMMAGGMGNFMMGGGGGGGMMGGMNSMMGGGGTSTGVGGGIAANMIRQHVSNAVQFIVGPEAKPDQAIMAYATSQGRVPRTMFEMLPYLPYLQEIARTTYGQWLEAEATANSATSSTSGTKSNSTVATDQAAKDKHLTALKRSLEATIMRRSIEYMNRPQTQQAAAGAGMMAVMGQMIPNMIRGIAAQYM